MKVGWSRPRRALSAAAAHQVEVSINWRPCFLAAQFYVSTMELTYTQDLAIQAKVAQVIGSEVFDRVFAGVRFVEIDGPLLYVYAKDEQVSAEIEDDFSLLIANVAS